MELKEGNYPSYEKRKRKNLHRPILATQLCLSPPIHIIYNTYCHYTIYSDVRFAQTMPPQRIKPFNNAHIIAFGLKVCECGPSTKVIVSVIRLFCVHLGREDKVVAKGKATSNIQK